MRALKMCVFAATATGVLCLAQNASLSVAITDLEPSGKLATITNTGSQPITAFVALGQQTPYTGRSSSTTVIYYDSALNSHELPIPPGGTKTHVYGRGSTRPALMTLELKAALFADGTSYGDPTWVARLVKARQVKYQYLGTAIEKLTSYPASTELSVIVNDFRMLEQQAHQIGDPEEASTAAGTFSVAADTLSQMVPHGTSTATGISVMVKIFTDRQAPLKAALHIQ